MINIPINQSEFGSLINRKMYIIHKQSGYFETFSKLIEEILGEPCKFSNNPDEEGTWILFFTSFISGFYKKVNQPYVVVQTEPKTNFNRFPEYKKMCDNASKVWDFSDNFEIRYSDTFRIDSEQSKDIDVLFYGVLSQRRKTLLDKIETNNKLVLHTSPPVYGPELWKYINRSKIILSISCYENRIEPDWFRIAPLLSNRSFVLCENVGDENFNNLKNYIPIANYENIPTIVKHFLKSPIARIRWADKGFDFIRNHKSKILN